MYSVVLRIYPVLLDYFCRHFCNSYKVFSQESLELNETYVFFVINHQLEPFHKVFKVREHYTCKTSRKIFIQLFAALTSPIQNNSVTLFCRSFHFKCLFQRNLMLTRQLQAWLLSSPSSYSASYSLSCFYPQSSMS